MKNYEDMSDFEINKAVALIVGATFNDDGEPVRFVECDTGAYADFNEIEFDPCNNSADAWPIIDENNITIINDHPSMRLAVNDVSGYYNGFSGIIASYDENGFRAAMIVFLKMNEDKL